MLGIAALTITNLELTVGFMGSGLLGLVVLLAVICALGVLLFGLFRRRRLLVVSALLGLLAVISSQLLSASLVEMQKRASFERGDSIATSLAAFHSVHGRYPGSLAELVPHYLEAVPASAMRVFGREDFHYSSSSSADEYELNFSAPGWSVCYRTALIVAWACDD